MSKQDDWNASGGAKACGAGKAAAGKKLCRYVMECHRSANLEGVFVVGPLQWEALCDLDGRTIFYGEVCGKHSDVCCEFALVDVEILSENDWEVEFFERVLPHGAGFHFLSYWIDNDRAIDAGGVAYRSGLWATPDEALAEDEYGQYRGHLLRGHFISGWDFSAA